ncbi:MAG: DUF6491 family protein [Robiginitomaculum sp.]|nr:DUF6491 family protein [Robiginitomaculum sp.]MDQ7076973.1 DUF6491 family protein [Robiginitomaculum sp.]
MKTFKPVLAAILGGLILGTGVTAYGADNGNKDTKSSSRRVVIPFVATTGLYSWRVGDDNSLLLEARHNDWYKATFKGYCPPLKFEYQIGVIADPMGSFDEFSKVLVDDRICYVDTLEHIANPDKAAKNKAS